MSLYLFFCRKNSCSGDQDTDQQTEKCQPSEEPTDQRSVAAAEVTHESKPDSSQEPSQEPSLQEHGPSPPTATRPLSPSCYMRRLPPPAGFYLSKEHNYAQLCPLLWRRRYNQAIDCLEKALRQLHAARRRENRLRSTVLRLRDKRLKQALLVSQDGCKNRGSWAPGGEKRRGKGGCSHEESETDAKSEDIGVFEDRCVDQMELAGCFLSDTNSWSEEEKGYCFYCGRGQAQVGGQVSRRAAKSGKDAESTVQDCLKIQRSVETSTCSTTENSRDRQIMRLERLPGNSVDTSDSDIKTSQVLLQTQGAQPETPVGATLSDIHEQTVQFVGSEQKLLLPHMCEGEPEAVEQQHDLDLQQQQLFWIQDGAEGQVILVPVSAEDGLQSILKMDGVDDEAQGTLVSEVDLKGETGHLTESSGGLSREERACGGEHGDQHAVINTTLVEMREDVREKLKEHLEGFQLQLSTEFLT